MSRKKSEFMDSGGVEKFKLMGGGSGKNPGIIFLWGLRAFIDLLRVVFLSHVTVKQNETDNLIHK